MKRTFAIILALALSIIMLIPGFSVALAYDERNIETDTSNIDPNTEGLVPGIEGYKVFGPNAIVTYHPQRKSGTYYILDVLNWEGSSDCYKNGDTMYGSHTSQSSGPIQEIWVDGAIKKSGQGWYDSDRDHASGMFANCNTQMPTQVIKYTYIAHSWHHFHEYGYPDWNPETEDSQYG